MSHLSIFLSTPQFLHPSFLHPSTLKPKLAKHVPQLLQSLQTEKSLAIEASKRKGKRKGGHRSGKRHHCTSGTTLTHLLGETSDVEVDRKTRKIVSSDSYVLPFPWFSECTPFPDFSPFVCLSVCLSVSQFSILSDDFTTVAEC